MAETDYEDEFDKAFEGFGEEPKQPETPQADPAKPGEPTPAPETPKVEEPKKPDEPAPPADPNKKEEPETPPADPAKKAEDGTEPPKDPETPAEPEEPKPLTEEGLKSIISNVRAEERDAVKEVDNTTNEVLQAYYPDGLSNVLVHEATGKELRTPQDVVDASGGTMEIEEAARWLLNEQHKLDTEVAKIKDDARQIAETTISFKRDSIRALQKYEPLFKAYPSLQQKAFNLLMKQVKDDKEKGVILQAPDVMDLYDTYLEPYQLAYEHSTQQPATNPNPAPGTPAQPAPATPGADDRLDENGDGGMSEVDDPNDFAQQVTKELAKGL